jgi:PadR family transcriptional regulator PadR
MKSKEYIKGTIRTIILKLLSEHPRMYGYEINQKVAELSGNEIQLTYGALYPILYKLESEGMLTTESELVDNRARKYYSLSEKGKKIAVEKVSELRKFLETMEHVLKPDPSAKLGLQSWGI